MASATVSLRKLCGSIRRLHQRKDLPYLIENGLGEFLPPPALKVIALDYQEGLLQRLNDEVRGTSDENESIVQTIINAAPYRERTLTFNYASLALNNGYFLEQLKPPPSTPFVTHQTEISPKLATAIRDQHGSIAQLKSTFSSAVTGMFTSGYVWFVTDASGNTGVIPTFGAGTLLIRSRSYMGHTKNIEVTPDLGQFDRGNPYITSERGERQGEALYDVDSSEPFIEPDQRSMKGSLHASTLTPRSPTAPPLSGVIPQSPISGLRSKCTPVAPGAPGPRLLHETPETRSEYEFEQPTPTGLYDGSPVPRTMSRTKSDMLYLGDVIYPLFSLSVHEHAWMAAGYGVWGKETWLKKFWTVLDWAKISQTYEALSANS